MSQPRAAERARTMAFGLAPGTLTVPGAEDVLVSHATDTTGAPLLLVPAGLDGDDLPALLSVTDIAPVPLADRVRGHLCLQGWVTLAPDRSAARVLELHPQAAGAEWKVMLMDVAEIVVGTTEVEPEDYAAAAPDPFVAVEASVLRHLDSHHRTELAAVCGRPARPVTLNRHGLRLRPDGRTDLWCGFGEPVTCLDDLRAAFRTLVTCRNAVQS